MIIEFANLQLEGYYVEHLHCSPQGLEKETPRLTLTPGLHVRYLKPLGLRPYNLMFSVESGQHETNPSRFMVVLRVESDPDDNKSPYVFDVTLVGYFRSRIKPSPVLEPHLVSNAVMILYSSARELLASITGRGPFPALVLPTMHFDVSQDYPALPAKAVIKSSKKAVSRKPRKATKKR
jgi:hypothetical protein